MSTTVDQNVSRDESSKVSTNGLAKSSDHDTYQQEQMFQGSSTTYTASQDVADPFVPGYYVTFPGSSPTEAAWSAADPSPYYTGTYMPSGSAIFDYSAAQTAGYGWVPTMADYANWSVGMCGDGTGVYAPEGYYTVEMYTNGDSAADGCQYTVEQSLGAMTITDDGQPKPWALMTGTQGSGYRAGRKMPVGVGYSTQHWTRPMPQRANRLNGLTVKSNVPNAVVEQLQSDHDYNPAELTLNLTCARFFVIKSYSEDDVHRSIKYGIWCSTDYGNKRLDAAFRERDAKGPVLLLFSVNGSGHFCGVAEMTSSVDYESSAGVWAQDKWKGQFKVRWIYVKDVPNSQLRHIRLENNEGKPVTNSRDTQEVPSDKGKMVLHIIHHYRHTTSIFDDFVHYEKRQEETTPKQDDDSLNKQVL